MNNYLDENEEKLNKEFDKLKNSHKEVVSKQNELKKDLIKTTNKAIYIGCAAMGAIWIIGYIILNLI